MATFQPTERTTDEFITRLSSQAMSAVEGSTTGSSGDGTETTTDEFKTLLSSHATSAVEGNTTGSSRDGTAYSTTEFLTKSTGEVSVASTSTVSQATEELIFQETSDFTPTDVMETIPGLSTSEVVAIVAAILIFCILLIAHLLIRFRRQKKKKASESLPRAKNDRVTRSPINDLDCILPDTLRFGVFENETNSSSSCAGNQDSIHSKPAAMTPSNCIEPEYTTMVPNLLIAPSTQQDAATKAEHVTTASAGTASKAQQAKASEDSDPQYVTMGANNVNLEPMYADMKSAKKGQAHSNYVTMKPQGKSDNSNRIYVNLVSDNPHHEPAGVQMSTV